MSITPLDPHPGVATTLLLGFCKMIRPWLYTVTYGNNYSVDHSAMKYLNSAIQEILPFKDQQWSIASNFGKLKTFRKRLILYFVLDILPV